MFNVILTYSLQQPPIPKDYIVIPVGGGYPKTNYKIVGQSETKDQGERIGYEALMRELDDLAWLLGDPVLNQLEADEESDRKDIYRWHDAMEKEYQERLSAHRAEYDTKIEARRSALIAAHKQE